MRYPEKKKIMEMWIAAAAAAALITISSIVLILRYLLSEPYRGVGKDYYRTRRRFLLTGCASGTT